MGLEHVELELVNSVDLAAEFMRWLGERRTVLGFDTETGGLDPEREPLRLVQFGDADKGWAIPWERWGGVALEALTKYEGPLVAHTTQSSTSGSLNYTAVPDCLVSGSTTPGSCATS